MRISIPKHKPNENKHSKSAKLVRITKQKIANLIKISTPKQFLLKLDLWIFEGVNIVEGVEKQTQLVLEFFLVEKSSGQGKAILPQAIL